MKIVNKIVYCALGSVTTLFVISQIGSKSNQLEESQWLQIDEDIDDADVIRDNNIFFVETKSSRFRELSTHQACSIESAAKIYSERDVYVSLTSNGNAVNLKHTLMVRALRTYKNIHFKHLKIGDFAKETPVETWLAGNPLSTSKYEVSHTSDVLRFLILWKFGGIYLDLDAIVLKEAYLENYVCFEGDGSVLGSSIINLSGKIGRDMADKFIKNQLQHFDGSTWATNGPDVITRVLKEMCVKNGTIPNQCGIFTILPRKNCYEISYPEWRKFFSDDAAKEVLRRTNESYYIHLWNKMGNNFKVSLDSKAAIIDFARHSCPMVFDSRYNEF